MNLCTDQLAMLVAAPGQLISVSHVASDPNVSAMADVARAYPANHARAEEIFLMRPDLVVAGTYGSSSTFDMLRRLGIPVATFAPAQTLDGVGPAIAQMGAALGRESAATQIAAHFDDARVALATAGGDRPTAAIYGAGGYVSGDGGLAGEILSAAGLANAASGTRYADGGTMPLEVLALSAPDAVITPRPYHGASRAEAIFDHPALRDLKRPRGTGASTGRDWMCGTPHVLGAIADMTALRDDLLGE